MTLHDHAQCGHEELTTGGFRSVALDEEDRDLLAPADRDQVDLTGEPDHRFTVRYDRGDGIYVIEAYIVEVVDVIHQLADDGDLAVLADTSDEDGLITVVPNLETRPEHDRDEPLHDWNPCQQIAALITNELDQLVGAGA